MLAGRVAVVTGSTSGIGLGIACSLAKEGCSIVLHGSRGEDAAADAIAKVKGYNVDVLYVQASLASPDIGATEIIFKTIEKFSKIDILVNNAGIQHVTPVEAFETEMWDKVIAINLTSCFQTIKQSLPEMKKNNFGRIINISSVHGHVGSTGKSAYVAAKHGVIGLSKVVALENAQLNITCNCICPGWVLTPLVQKQIDVIAKDSNLSNEEATKILLSAKEPTGRFTTPEDIGGVVVMLCSSAGGNITGTEITMDGGWTCQ